MIYFGLGVKIWRKMMIAMEARTRVLRKREGGGRMLAIASLPRIQDDDDGFCGSTLKKY